ncbi:MAG TPA: hypothetical protein EYP24_04930 [bacterium (Candidatus Stahlbacteria)]|nr:hypothetical protein [Candidatus Stahlbacteria bacterium]
MVSTVIFIIFLGVFFWLSNHQLISFSKDWPLILIILGLLSLVFRKGKTRKDRIGVLKDLEEGKISAWEAEKELRGD